MGAKLMSPEEEGRFRNHARLNAKSVSLELEFAGRKIFDKRGPLEEKAALARELGLEPTPEIREEIASLERQTSEITRKREILREVEAEGFARRHARAERVQRRKHDNQWAHLQGGQGRFADRLGRLRRLLGLDELSKPEEVFAELERRLGGQQDSAA